MKAIKSLACIKSFRPKPLTDDSHKALSSSLRHFSLNNTHLVFKYQFEPAQYLDVLEKMNRIGILADRMDHHPEWTLQGNSLTIGLSTHEIGGEVSFKDYVLGHWIEQILHEPTLEQSMVESWNKLNISYD